MHTGPEMAERSVCVSAECSHANDECGRGGWECGGWGCELSAHVEGTVSYGS